MSFYKGFWKKKLGETGISLDDHLDTIWDKINKIDARLDAVCAVLQEPALNADGATTGIERELINYRASLNEISMQLTPLRNNLGRQDEVVHRAIANSYKHFVIMDLLGAVDDSFDRAPGEDVLADGVAALSRLLFSAEGDSVTPEDAHRWLADQGFDLPVKEIAKLREKAARIKERGNETGFPAYWDFEVNPGTPIDPVTQKAWPGSDESAPVKRMVSPGYKVGDKTIQEQYVLTAPLTLTRAAHDTEAQPE